jgi:osmotically inducible lipoprotein OsmB
MRLGGSVQTRTRAPRTMQVLTLSSALVSFFAGLYPTKPGRFTMNSFARTSVLLAVIATAALTGCSNMSRRDQNVVGGAAIGAVAGAVLTGGSPVGTVGGAAVGGVIGNEVGKKQ